MFKLFSFTFTWHDVFVQALGFASFALFMLAYQIKDTRKTQRLFAPGNLLYGAQYFLLGSLNGCLIMSAAAARDLVGGYGSDRALKIASGLYLAFIWTATFMVGKDYHEYLMAMSGTVSTAAVLLRDSFYKFRFLLMIRQTFMIFFNLWIQSYGGSLHLCMTLLSNIIGTYRHYRRPRKADGNYIDE